MKQKILLALAVLLTACSNEEDIFPGNSGFDNTADSIVVLQKRNPELPTEWSKKVVKTRVLSSGLIPLGDYIGYGYTVGNSILGECTNVTSPVIDLTKLRAKSPSAISPLPANATTIFKSAYTDYNRYEKNTSLTKVVKAGFNLNLGFFKIGRENTQTEIFKTTKITEDKKVYGELGIEYRRGRYTLNTTNVVVKKIASEYLDDNFLLSLYITPISQIVEDYGPLVVAGYFTGGRATALYEGSTNYKQDFESTEKEMNDKINCSFSFGEDDKQPEDSIVSANLDFSKKDGYNETETNKIENMYCYVRTIGGLATVDMSAETIDKLNLNLTPWVSSLADETSHVMIGLEENGLVGLSEFVLEENFKRRIQDTHMGFAHNIELAEPFIEIVKVFVRYSTSGDKLYEIAPVLNTRQGDQIILSDGKATEATDEELKANNDYDVFMAKSRSITTEKSKYYQCEIRANSNKTLNPILRLPFNMSLPGLTESKMYKFKNVDTNMCYVYDSSKRYAFAFYDLEGFIPEVYGISSWLEGIPEKSISLIVLSQYYKIIGL